MLRLGTTAGAFTVIAMTLGAADRTGAQTPGRAPGHPVVCGKGVRVYTDAAQLPAKRDSVTMPPSDGPVRVTSPEEAEAAEQTMLARAGSVGATGVLIVDETTEVDGGIRTRRSLSAYFVPSDSARAQQACNK